MLGPRVATSVQASREVYCHSVQPVYSDSVRGIWGGRDPSSFPRSFICAHLLLASSTSPPLPVLLGHERAFGDARVA